MINPNDVIIMSHNLIMTSSWVIISDDVILKSKKTKKGISMAGDTKRVGALRTVKRSLDVFFWRSAVPLIKIDSEGIGGRRIEEIWLSRDHQDESSRMVKMTSSDESPRMTDQTQGGEQEMTSPKMTNSPKNEVNWPKSDSEFTENANSPKNSRFTENRVLAEIGLDESFCCRWRHPDMKINKYRIINLRDKKKLENL
jgi:hypothetical protein